MSSVVGISALSSWIIGTSAARSMKALNQDSNLFTDKAAHFRNFVRGEHESIDHSKFEWSRGEANTNTLEGFFSIFKGKRLTYQTARSAEE